MLDSIKKANIKRQDALYWIILVIAIIILVYVFSSLQFSLIFTLAGTVQMFGFALLLIKVTKHHSVSGLSRQTFVCYTIIFSIRTVLFLIFKGYLPDDTTGDTIFRMQQIIATALTAYILYCIDHQYNSSYDRLMEGTKSYALIIIAALLALVFHSDLNNSFLGDYLWAFTQYLQTVAILPQFMLFRNKGEIQVSTSHFVAAQGISRVLFIVFWIFTYAQLNTDKSMSLLSQYVGYWFMTSQLIHLVIMADFLYYWIKCARNGFIGLPSYV